MHPRYLKHLEELCKASEITLDYLRTKSSKKDPIKDKILYQMRQEFPSLSLVRLGELTNRNYSTIICAINRHTKLVE